MTPPSSPLRDDIICERSLRSGVFNSKTGLVKVNLPLAIIKKRRASSTIDNKIDLVCEKQVNTCGVIFLNTT